MSRSLPLLVGDFAIASFLAFSEERDRAVEVRVVAPRPRRRRALRVAPVERQLQLRVAPQSGLALPYKRAACSVAGRSRPTALLLGPFHQTRPEAHQALVRQIDDGSFVQSASTAAPGTTGRALETDRSRAVISLRRASAIWHSSRTRHGRRRPRASGCVSVSALNTLSASCRLALGVSSP